MEENMNQKPTGGTEGGDAGNAERKRRRGHRGGKNHKRHRENTAPAEEIAAPQSNASDNTPPAEEKKKKNDRKGDQKKDRRNDAQNDRQGAQRNDKRDGGKGKRGHGKRNGSYRPDHLSQKDDIYGDPKEEQELAEWRAKIVLNADSETPPVSLESTSPAPEKEEEPVELPDGIDLFESPIMATPSASEAERVEVIGIRFRSAGKTYYFAPGNTKVQKGAFAIVETARGPEFGEVYLSNTMVKASETVTPLRPLLRVATPEDIAHNEENRKKEREALTICEKKIAEHKLDMKLIDVQYAFDNSKLLFYFASEGRVDFRELVKDLASVFRTRIELRQIGIRDEAKMLGGFGACGRVLCCSTFLPDFAQVSIKMAKEQGLSLNSTKISGMCGRLMCCLRFESDVYAEEIRRTPSQGSLVKTEDGIGTVISVNPLAGTVRVVLRDTPDTPPKQYHRDNITLLPREKHHPDAQGKENQDS